MLSPMDFLWAYLITGELLAILLINHQAISAAADAPKERRPVALCGAATFIVLMWPVVVFWLLSRDEN